MDYSVLRPIDSLDRALYDMVARLGQHLYSHIIGDAVFIDQAAYKLKFGIGSRREADLYLLEAQLYQVVEKLQLLLGRHRRIKSLVAIAQIDAAPHGSLCYLVIRPGAVFYGHLMIHFLVFVTVHSGSSFLWLGCFGNKKTEPQCDSADIPVLFLRARKQN